MRRPPSPADRRRRMRGSWTSARGPSWTSVARRSGSCSSATRPGPSSTRDTSRTTKSTALRYFLLAGSCNGWVVSSTSSVSASNKMVAVKSCPHHCLRLSRRNWLRCRFCLCCFNIRICGQVCPHEGSYSAYAVSAAEGSAGRDPGAAGRREAGASALLPRPDADHHHARRDGPGHEAGPQPPLLHAHQ